MFQLINNIVTNVKWITILSFWYKTNRKEVQKHTKIM